MLRCDTFFLVTTFFEKIVNIDVEVMEIGKQVTRKLVDIVMGRKSGC